MIQGKRDSHEMELEEVDSITMGHDTMAFWKQIVARGTQSIPQPELCFSLVCDDRTLDFAAESLQQAKAWQDAFKYVMDQIWAERNGHVLPGQPLEALPEGASREQIMQVRVTTRICKNPLSIYDMI